jgi:hypothetical protein
VLVASLLSMTVRMVLTLSAPAVSLFSIYALAAVILVTGSRASYQILAASRWRVASGGMPTLIYGAGRKGASALRELVADPSATLRPVAFIDDDASKDGRIVNGIPIVGSIQTIDRAIRRFGVRAVIIASDALSELRMAELSELCERFEVALLRMRVSLDSVGKGGGHAFSAAAAMAMWSSPDAKPAARPDLLPPVRAVASGAQLDQSALRIRFEEAQEPAMTVPVVASERCPTCGSGQLHRSHVRKVSERLRKRLTDKRLFRCEGCGWRGWNGIVDHAAYGPFPLTTEPLPRGRAS